MKKKKEKKVLDKANWRHRLHSICDGALAHAMRTAFESCNCVFFFLLPRCDGKKKKRETISRFFFSTCDHTRTYKRAHHEEEGGERRIVHPIPLKAPSLSSTERGH